MSASNRREFLADVGRGMLSAAVGAGLAADMGLASVAAAAEAGAATKLDFGALEPLVALMQDTPPEKLLPLLVERIAKGTDLRTMTAAGALANARTFGGEDYIGYHTFMALAPAYEMSKQMPKGREALPVLKVLHRNATRIQAHGGHASEKLRVIEPAALPSDRDGGELLQELVRKRDRDAAERAFAAMVDHDAGEAYHHLQFEIEDEVDVHRVVLSWRAWATLDLVGREHAHTLLRQSVRYCLQSEQYLHERNLQPSAIRTQLPKLFDQYKLAGKPLGTRRADDAWIEAFSKLVFGKSREEAADAAAAALAEGISPDSIGEAISVASNLLVLHDPGRAQANTPDKPVGSCHGDSVGVHASDSANAWRNIAKVSNARNTAASLIVGAFHTAGQGNRLNKQPYPTAEQLSEITNRDPAVLLRELDGAVREKNQFRACALAALYADGGAEVRPAFDLLLGFATSEDGALHAEKYFRTCTEEYATMRPAFRNRQLAALARVSASEFGKPAPGYVQAKELLKV